MPAIGSAHRALDDVDALKERGIHKGGNPADHRHAAKVDLAAAKTADGVGASVARHHRFSPLIDAWLQTNQLVQIGRITLANKVLGQGINHEGHLLRWERHEASGLILLYAKLR